jgi:hypothetical protein
VLQDADLAVPTLGLEPPASKPPEG